jgi:ABC-type antimicrobial peptide transport system permease subunit
MIWCGVWLSGPLSLPIVKVGDDARRARPNLGGTRKLGPTGPAMAGVGGWWTPVVPPVASVGGAALLIGAVAGLMPALRASRMSPMEALAAA